MNIFFVIPDDRDCCATDNGVALNKVQGAAGHADPRTTERYWRTKENLDNNAVDYVKL